MSQSIRIAILMVVFSVVITGCYKSTSSGNSLAENTEAINPIETTYSALPIFLFTPAPMPIAITSFPTWVTLELDTSAGSYHIDFDEITATWINHTDEELVFSTAFCLEKKVSGDWERLSRIGDDLNRSSPLKTVPPHSIRGWIYCLGDHYGRLEVGEYRIAIDFTIGCTSYTAYEEFSVVVMSPDGISLTLESYIYPVSIDVMKATIHNSTDRWLVYAHRYALEKRTNGGWEKICYTRDRSWIGYPYHISPPGRDCGFGVDYWFGSLQPGDYRIAVNISGYWVYAEFLVA